MSNCFFLLFTLLVCPSLQKPPPSSKHSGFIEADNVGDAIDSMEPSCPQNIWELSGKFEGDIMLGPNEIDVKNVRRNETSRWPNATLVYHIHESFEEEEIQRIKKAMAEIENSSCVKFKEYSEGDKDYVLIENDESGCWSYIGRIGSRQKLNLNREEGCLTHDTIIHEFLHALGFHHQQSASNRDDYVTIHWENIKEKGCLFKIRSPYYIICCQYSISDNDSMDPKNNFKVMKEWKVTDFGVGYDYDSVMHYSRCAFSKNDKPTITTVEEGVKIGQRDRLSDKDKMKLNIMYNCNKVEAEVESSDTN
ncbi:zinc metalloproteinase nas-13 [Nilaparvata lugens]|uniref:zinc metalloproteinase nas-13 n=1 Tax=Nilaparvata lugens TaxID=108931 RepID=UPI00193DACED|nr:zinc metalloproteinase nas-13 [Nilaparvata lugens]